MNSPLLQARHVRKAFDSRTRPLEVLKDIELTIEPRDRIAILGKSGAGKSTLLHILGALEAPSGGSVHFQGRDIFQLGERELAVFRNRCIGFVFQFHYLMLEFNALENVMMPALLGGTPKGEAKSRAQDLLKAVGLKDRWSQKPSALSGGEQQRVAIARALMQRPAIFLTDEMTGNLDPATGNQVLSLVESIHGEFGMAMVSVTHDETLAGTYPKIFRLTDGSLVAEKG